MRKRRAQSSVLEKQPESADFQLRSWVRLAPRCRAVLSPAPLSLSRAPGSASSCGRGPGARGVCAWESALRSARLPAGPRPSLLPPLLPGALPGTRPYPMCLPRSASVSSLLYSSHMVADAGAPCVSRKPGCVLRRPPPPSPRVPWPGRRGHRWHRPAGPPLFNPAASGVARPLPAVPGQSRPASSLVPASRPPPALRLSPAVFLTLSPRLFLLPAGGFPLSHSRGSSWVLLLRFCSSLRGRSVLAIPRARVFSAST